VVPVSFLAAYGNGASLALAEASHSGGWLGVVVGAVPAAAVFVWGRRMAMLSASDVGLTSTGAVRSATIGLLVGLGLALPAIVVLHGPPLVGQPVTHAPISSLAPEALVWRALVWMPLDTAVPEELAFRGVLLASLYRQFSAGRAVLISAFAFTLWHAVIVSRTLSVTNLADEPWLLALGQVSSFVAIFVGGIVFAVLRLCTGHLAGSIVSHWAFNAALLVGLYGTPR
jgi:uncharacterized protein